MVIAVPSYTRWPSLMEGSVDRALRTLRTDYVDTLCLAWWSGAPPAAVMDAALALRDKGKVRNEETPRPSDCYRFALTSPHVDVCLAAPKDAAQDVSGNELGESRAAQDPIAPG
jgi:hypothetical protein